MPADEQPRDQSRERSALEELERLHHAIEQSRRKRREAADAFDSFLRSFDRRSPGTTSPGATAANVRVQPRTSEPPPLPPSGVLPPGPVSATAAGARPTSAAAETSPPAVKSAGPAVASAQIAQSPGSPGVETVPPTESMPGAAEHVDHRTETDQHRTSGPVVPAALTGAAAPSRTATWWVLAVAAVVVVAALSWMTSGRGAAPTAPAPAAATTPPPQAEPPPPVTAPIAPVTELATERRVWVRVTVDGERVIERELDAGVRIPLKANERIVIRAGDAGAVRLTIAGKDQGVFGPDGIAVTRTFEVPPASPR